MAKKQPAEKATKMTAAKKAPVKKAVENKVDLKVFDPATIPVMACEVKSFKIQGSTRQRVRIVDLNGVAAAAIRVNEHLAPYMLANGKTLAYVGEELCHVTTNMAQIKTAVGEGSVHLMAQYLEFFCDHIGQPISLDVPEFKNESGDPYKLYANCEDSADFDKVDAEMAAKYQTMLEFNAGYALHPMEEPSELFVEFVEGRTLKDAILNLVVGAHEHEKYAKEWHDIAIQFSNVWKAKHKLRKVDHACPRYRAFTRTPWMQHKYHRGLAALARANLSRVTEQYAQTSDVPLMASPQVLTNNVAPQPLKLVSAKLPCLEELDESIPF